MFVSELNKYKTKNTIILREFDISRMALVAGLLSLSVLFFTFLSLHDRLYSVVVSVVVCGALYLFGFNELIFEDGGSLYVAAGFTVLGNEKISIFKISDIQRITAIAERGESKDKDGMRKCRYEYEIEMKNGKKVTAPLDDIYKFSKFRSVLAQHNSGIIYDEKTI